MPEWIEIQPARGPVDAVVELPGSKSYTNRVLLLAALAAGTSILRGALFSEDTAHMADSLGRLGIGVEADEAACQFRVHGAGGRIPARRADLFVGNSGTTVRFLTAAVALGHGRYTLDGVPRMRERPIAPLLDGLRQLGVDARSTLGTGCPPVEVWADGLRGGAARIPGDLSSQYFSALLMVAPLAAGEIVIEVEGDLVSKPYIDLTADSMRRFGATFDHDAYRRFVVPGRQRYTAEDYTVEPDASAASYFFAAAAVTGGRVRVHHLDAGSAQGDLRLVDVLERMGCRVTWGDDWVEVQGPAEGRLRGVDADMNAISDTVQSLAAIAPFADGPVTIRDVGHIRHKETDRLEAVATELAKLGVPVATGPDWLRVEPAVPHAGEVATYADHRMAMSFSLIGLRVPGIRILDPGCVAKTFPEFFLRFAALTG